MSILDELRGYALIYMASPYSLYTHGLDQACEDVSGVAGDLLERGVRVFCPVSHAHTIAQSSCVNPLDHKLWMTLDKAVADHCQALIVVELEGWQDSVGVREEIEWFRGRPIYHINPQAMIIRRASPVS